MDTSALFRYPESQHDQTHGFLAQLHEDEVAAVLTFTQPRIYRAGEFAVRQGERDRTLFLIVSGRFEIVPTGGRRRAAVLQGGDIFGELSFFDAEPRSADVRAIEDSEALALTTEGFERLRVANPRLALKTVMDLGRVLSQRFRERSRQLSELGRL